MKTFGTLTLLSAGALFMFSVLTSGITGVLLGVAAVVYLTLAATFITGLVSIFWGFLIQGPNGKGPVWILVPFLPLWSAIFLIYVTGRYWFNVLAASQWEDEDYYFTGHDEEYWLRENEAEFHEAVANLSFKPWVWL